METGISLELDCSEIAETTTDMDMSAMLSYASNWESRQIDTVNSMADFTTIGLTMIVVICILVGLIGVRLAVK